MDTFTSSTLLNADHEEKLADSLNDYLGGNNILIQVGKVNNSVEPIIQHELDKFYRDIKGQTVIVESGIKFPTGEVQTVPYSGTIQHNELIGLDNNDHSQYLTDIGGAMSGNLAVSGVWINSSGVDNRGISFRSISGTSDSFIIGDNTSLVFDNDDSKMDSAAGCAKAWITFDSTEDPLVVKSSYNIDTIKKVSSGKFIVTFKDNITGIYSAVTSSSGQSGDLAQDISFVNASCNFRKPNSCGFVVQNRAGQYIDSTTNDLVIFSIN
tara:strand:+ start:1571 stop:2371 length:801 start_codon:yes stop_codon:yes gene_type:complete